MRFAITVLATLLFAGCADDGERVCEPGETQRCLCAGSTAGAQSCADDGTRWEACRCANKADAATLVDAGVDATRYDSKRVSPDTTPADGRAADSFRADLKIPDASVPDSSPDLNADTSASKRIAQLTRSTTLDPDEQYLKGLLGGSQHPTVTLTASAVAAGKLAGTSLVYMRTSAEPVSYKGANAAAIKALVQGGATLVVEHYGAHLAAYLGLGTVKTWNWNPAGKSQFYWVTGKTSHPLLNAITSWDPPTAPNKPSQLIRQTIKTGTTVATYLEPASGTTRDLLHYWFLTQSPGAWQSTNNSYCLAHPGLCTSTRSVRETAIPPSQRHLGAPIIVFAVGSGKVIVFHHGVSVAWAKPEAMGAAIREAIIDYGLR